MNQFFNIECVLADSTAKHAVKFMIHDCNHTIYMSSISDGRYTAIVPRFLVIE